MVSTFHVVKQWNNNMQITRRTERQLQQAEQTAGHNRIRAEQPPKTLGKFEQARLPPTFPQPPDLPPRPRRPPQLPPVPPGGPREPNKPRGPQR